MSPPKKAFLSGADSPYQGEMSRSDRGDRERWHGEAVTDEGAMTERFRFLQGEFRRLRAAGEFRPAGRVSFWTPRKKPKRRQGAAQDERFALIFAAPGPHFTEVTP